MPYKRITVYVLLACYAKVSSTSDGATCALSADLHIPSTHLAAVHSALACWSSQGAWVAHGPGFEWKPDDSCPLFERYVKGGVACGIAAELQSLYPTRRRGLRDHALFVGDSISGQFYRSFASNSRRPSQLVGLDAHLLTASTCESVPPIIPFNGCPRDTGSSSSFSAQFRRSDRLSPWPACGSNKTAYFTEVEWSSLLPGASVVELNRGSHYETDERYIAGWSKTLQFVIDQAPRSLVVARTTPVGHVNCTSYKTPVSSAQLASPGELYNWKDFGAQNALLRNLLRDKFPNVLLLDIEHLASLRPDAHRGRNSKGVVDCLHWQDGTVGAGVLNAPHFFLYNALRFLRLASSNHTFVKHNSVK